MKNAAVIGSGNLGRRHLEALLKLGQPLNVSVTDTAPSSLRLAEEVNCLHNAEKKHSFAICENLHMLPDDLDFVVVATNSANRREITETLLKQKNVKHLLLEKVLFQKSDDYDAVDSLLKNSKTKVWVNCNMQTVPIYASVKEQLNKSKEFHFSVMGGQWNLGCSAIHYLSLIAYLCGTSDGFFIDGSRLDDGYINSKREGFIEFGGTLSGNAPGCSSFSITCNNNWYSPIVVTVQNENISVTLYENGYMYFSSRENNWEVEETKIRFPYQSEITGLLFSELTETGTCGLPTYADSAKLHKELIKTFLAHLNKYEETDICKIT
jgi:predicted dehydrogenase